MKPVSGRKSKLKPRMRQRLWGFKLFSFACTLLSLKFPSLAYYAVNTKKARLVCVSEINYCIWFFKSPHCKKTQWMAKQIQTRVALFWEKKQLGLQGVIERKYFLSFRNATSGLYLRQRMCHLKCLVRYVMEKTFKEVFSKSGVLKHEKGINHVDLPKSSLDRCSSSM